MDGSFKVYGAGLLSSVAELKHAITATDKIKKFDPEVTCHEECIVTSYQNSYFYTDSFEEAKEKLRFERILIKIQKNRKFYCHLISEFSQLISRDLSWSDIIHILRLLTF